MTQVIIEVILKMMELKIVQRFDQSIDVLKILVIANVFQHGNQNICLMKVLNLLLHLTVFLQHLKFDRSCLKQNKLTFTYKNKVNIYIVSEINLWPFKQSTDFA